MSSDDYKDVLRLMIKREEVKFREWEKGIEEDVGKSESLLSPCYKSILWFFKDIRIKYQHYNYRTVNLFSRFIRNLGKSKNEHALNIHKEILNQTPISKKHLIQIQIACLIIPIKYHEDRTLTSTEFVIRNFHKYWKFYDPVCWEFLVLFETNFDLGMNSPEDFIYAIIYSSPKETFTSEVYNIAVRLMDITCLSYNALKFKPSIIAISCIWLACRMCNFEWPVNQIEKLPLNYTGEEIITDCINTILETLEDVCEWRIYFNEDDIFFDKIACKISSWLFELEIACP